MRSFIIGVSMSIPLTLEEDAIFMITEIINKLLLFLKGGIIYFLKLFVV